jgi:AcrR family transcriptional regulator
VNRTEAQKSLRDLRRKQIVAAARALVAAKGLDALTFGALEKTLKYSRGVITYHFRDKDEIVAAVLESALREIDSSTQHQVDAGATPREKVRAVLSANLRGFLEKREAALILLSFWGRIGSDPLVRKLNAQLYATYRKRTASVLAAFPGVEAKAMSALIVGIVIGLAAQACFEPGSIDTDAALEEAVRVVLSSSDGSGRRS